MKKNIINTVLIVFPIVIILILMNKYHFLYNTACRTGIAGLKFLAIYAGIFIIIAIVIKLIKRSKNQGRCSLCKARIKDDWEICPYCGADDFERGTTK